MKFGAVTKVSTFLIITQVSSGLKQIVYSLKSCVTIGMKANVWPCIVSMDYVSGLVLCSGLERQDKNIGHTHSLLWLFSTFLSFHLGCNETNEFPQVIPVYHRSVHLSLHKIDMYCQVVCQ